MGSRSGVKNGEPQAWLAAHRDWQGDGCLRWPYNSRGHVYGRLIYKGRRTYAHAAMCEEVNGPRPSPDHEARHLCGLGHEGCVTPGHLVWGTSKENAEDRTRHPRHNRGERNGQAVLTESDVLAIKALRREGALQREIATRFGIARQTVGQIERGERWSYLG